MAVAVLDIIEAARSTHESFAPEPHPNRVCLAYLSRYHRTLTSRVASLDPYSMASIQNVLKATWVAGWDKGDTGVAALAHHAYLQGRANHLDGESWDILHVTAWPTRPREFRQVNDSFWPAYSIVAGNIYLHGSVQGWERYASIDLYYVAMTAALTDTDDITLPDSAYPALVAALAYHLCQRAANQPGAPKCALLRQDWIDAERSFLDEIGGHQAERSSATQDVW